MFFKKIKQTHRKILANYQKDELSPELKIQMGEEGPEIIEPIETSTPLKTEEIEDIYNQEKEDFLRTALTVNKTDLETAVDMAEESNKALIDEIIDPVPGLIVHNTVNVDSQLDFEKNYLDTTFRLSNTLQERLDNILDETRKKISSVKFPGEAVVEILKIFILMIVSKKFLTPKINCFFHNDRRDFEVNVGGDEFIVFKSPALTTVNC